MKVKIIFLYLVINTSFCVQVHGQKEALKWYFEQNNGLDFSGDTVKFLSGCQFGKNESSSSICDLNGELLFYSNGITLYNKYNTIVKNGTGLGFGGNSTTSYQGTLLIKHPDNDSLIYLFSTDNQGKGGGLVYAIIRIHGNNDSGEVLQKKIKLISPVNEPVSAVYHQNGRDIWIVCHSYGKDYFYAYLINKIGITSCPVVSQIGAYHFDGGADAQVAIKFSPNGKFITHDQLLWGNTETFHFNYETGEIRDTVFSNPLNVVFGYEFSPNSQFLYIRQSDSGLIQIDLEKKIKLKLNSFNQSLLPSSLQLGPDGKIYGNIANTKHLFVINKPNKAGDSCEITIKQNFLQNIVPTALPNFNQSYFNTPSLDFKYEQNCLNNKIQFWGKDTFSAITHQWQITRNKAIIANYFIGNPNHIFIDTGTYNVRYIASNGSRNDTVSKGITIFSKISKNFLGKDTFYAQGTSFNKALTTPPNLHCIKWQDGSGLTIYTVETVGVYTCKITNKSFCEVIDTIVISECINSLIQPSLYRSRDSLYTYQQSADSFVWFRNNVQYRITKEPFIRLTDTGTYRVEAAKKGHCNRSSITNHVNKLGINYFLSSDFNIQLFPIPSSEQVFIKADKDFILQVSDITGRIITVQENIDSISLPKGVYFFTFTIDAYKIIEKVVVL